MKRFKKSFFDFGTEWMRFLLGMSLIFSLVYAYEMKMFNLIFAMSELLLRLSIFTFAIVIAYETIRIIIMFFKRRKING